MTKDEIKALTLKDCDAARPPSTWDTIQHYCSAKTYTFIYSADEDSQDFVTVTATSEDQARQYAKRELAGSFGARYISLFEVK